MIGDTPQMRELSVTEQRYQAVLAVVSDGETVSSVAARFGVHRKTVHGWLARYEAEGMEGLADRSHRPRSCPHQTAADVEAAIATMRSSHPGWGPRRLVFELARAGVDPVPSESAVYRALVRLNLIDPSGRRRRDRKWKRWERGVPMELWQMDVVGGFVLADGRRAKALTGVDDHSRFCVCAHLMLRESSPNVCDGLAAALRTYGVPGQILTDNGKVFTGRYNRPPVEVLFDRICRENGIEHLHTQTGPTRRSTWPPRLPGSSPVTTQPSGRCVRHPTRARPTARARGAATEPGSPAAPAPSEWCA